jgi:hypothetical protein
MKARKYLYFAILGLLCSICLPALWAQTETSQPATGSLRGQVADPSGAAIPGASVVLTPATGSPVVIQSDAQGGYDFKGVPAGKYTLTVAATGFTLYENDNVVISSQPIRLNVTMAIEVETQKVQVSDTAPTIDVNPNNNAGAIVLSGKELDALPDDPDELESDLEALAGPSAGPNGGQMYIDGFTAGQLPPKSSIREIRINQNPFSSEYDKLGYGRIEIFTKPGTDKLHGQVFADGNDSPFNTPNPFAGSEPPYYSTQFNGNIGGPLRKNASFFFNLERRDINEVAAVNAVDPATGGNLAEAVGNPRQRTNVGPRLDWAPTKNNTVTVRYQYYRDTETNTGVGNFYLPSQGYYSKSIENTLQISDTQVFGSKIVNETRFQYLRDTNIQDPNDLNPTVTVNGRFTGGGNSEGTLNDLQNGYEGQNYTSVIHGNHILKFGGRVRFTHDSDFSTSFFNGTFTFPTYQAFTSAAPTQFAYTVGSPNAAVDDYDIEPYVQDDWKVRPNITLSYGLRFETQNVIHDKADWAPRVGFAWGVGGRNAPPKVVIRGGSGIFYDRFQIQNLLQAERLDGITQTRYVITNPTCYPGQLDQPITAPLSSCGTATSTASTVYQLSPRLHAPYTLQSAISVERQVTKSATLSLTYLNSRGFDQFLTINADAPYPGTPCVNCTPTSNLYRYVSEGNFKQNQFIVNTNVRVGSRLQLFGYYTLNYANSDTAGVNYFPSNSWDISQDWGRSSFDVRHRLFLGGTVGLPYLLRFSPFMILSSGTPYNVTSPVDLNGDSQYNDRPGYVSTATCPNPPGGASPTPTGPNSSIYCTPLGTFDVLPNLAPTPERIVPINFATGPNHFVMNFRLTKTIGLGARTKEGGPTPGGGPGQGGGGHRGGGGPRGPLFGGGPTMMSANSDRRYNLTLGVSMRNAFNDVNVANPSGVVGSRFFDTANALQGGSFAGTSAANRRIDFQAIFTF